MDNGTIKSSAMLDTPFDVDGPTASLKAFLNLETYKPVFSFS